MVTVMKYITCMSTIMYHFIGRRDTIMSHAMERFSFTEHIISTTLLQGDLFPQHRKKFPDTALEATVDAYPMLDKARLKTKLSLIYEHEDSQGCSVALALFQVLMENNLKDTFSETKSSQDPPHYTRIREVLISTLKRIKKFLGNTMTQDRLNALAMLSIEKKPHAGHSRFQNKGH